MRFLANASASNRFVLKMISGPAKLRVGYVKEASGENLGKECSIQTLSLQMLP